MKELGKLHQKCPLNDDDTWKAYAMDKIAGKIRRLPFQVTLERESQLRLKSIHGLGASTLEKINQFLQTGYIERTKEFKRDPERMAMKQMMGIWGVGRKTVGFEICVVCCALLVFCLGGLVYSLDGANKNLMVILTYLRLVLPIKINPCRR